MRQKIDPQYKMHRQDTRTEQDLVRIQEMYVQVDRFWAQFGKHLPITWAESAVYEADDIMSMYAHEAKLSQTNTLIVTGDKDILQCVNAYTSVYSPNAKGTRTLDNFGETGYPDPTAYLLGKCLQGDDGDNVPGIPGIGEKRAQTILRDHLWNIHALKTKPLETLSRTVWGKELAKPSSWDRIRLNWKLMSLLGPVHKRLQEDKITRKYGQLNTKELRMALAKNQFASILADWNNFIKPFEVMQ
jgi:5'-3' exonuclease